MITVTRHYPRTVLERLNTVSPECWSVYLGTESFADDAAIDAMRAWAESHPYGRFITFIHRNRNNYTLEFDRESEYMEFMLRWL